MVERFNDRFDDVLNTHRFIDSEDLEHTLLRYVALKPPATAVSAQEQDIYAGREGMARSCSTRGHTIARDETR